MRLLYNDFDQNPDRMQWLYSRSFNSMYLGRFSENENEGLVRRTGQPVNEF